MSRYILYFFILGIISSCANQTAPTGGPKDTIPPTLLQSNPEMQSINFQGDEIFLEFDEYVKLNNPNQQIIITPRLDRQINYTVKRNRVIIDLDGSLPDNTTYNINFRDAIQDITEGNPVNLSFAFSTGPYIDSLRISGNVKDLLRDNSVEDALVALQVPSDSAYYFQLPALYFTNTDEDGKFQFNNLKADSYRLYAFKDQNNDLILQPQAEKHGFLKNNISLLKDTAGINIPLVSTNPDTLKVLSDRQAGRYYQVSFNKPIIEVSLDSVNRAIPYILSDDFKTLRFFQIAQYDGSTLIINARDSVGFEVDQSITIDYEPTVRAPFDFLASYQPISILKNNPQVDISLTFNKPVQDLLTDSIYFYIDSAFTLPVTNNYNFDSTRTRLDLKFQLPDTLFRSVNNTPGAPSPGDNLKPYLYVAEGSIISVDEDSVSTFKVSSNLYRKNQLGDLIVTIDVPFENYIVELLDNKFKVLQRRYNSSKITFANLQPSTYYLRVLNDRDKDQFWYIGNIYQNNIPDQVIFYRHSTENTREIIIRANFENEIPVTMPGAVDN